MPNNAVRVETLTVLSRFRTGFYACLTARVDALFELTDALLCTKGRSGPWSGCRWHPNTVAGTARCTTR